MDTIKTLIGCCEFPIMIKIIEDSKETRSCVNCHQNLDKRYEKISDYYSEHLAHILRK